MDRVTLGKTGIEVNKNGFGALPIQRVTKKEAVYLLQKAFYNGINYFDTARAYSDSEEKMGAAFEYTRDKIVISTKTQAQTGSDMRKDLEESLRKLQTDYIDIYQFHNRATEPDSTKRPLRQKKRERSVISASRITGSLWQKKRSNPDCTKQCSSRFLIWQRNRISRS